MMLDDTTDTNKDCDLCVCIFVYVHDYMTVRCIKGYTELNACSD